MNVKKHLPIILFLILFNVLFSFAYSQQNNNENTSFKTRVALIPMINVSDDDRYNAIVKTVTDTVELTLRLIGKYSVMKINNFNPYENSDYLRKYAVNNKIDNILFGKAFKGKDGNIILEMSVYDRIKDKTTITKRKKSESILDIFDVSDELIKNLITVFSGVHVGFGNIKIINKGEKGDYEVLLNGESIGNNIDHIDKVLNGEYLIEIKQNRMFGEKVIFSSKIYVYEDREIQVTFKIPYMTEEEKNETESLINEVKSNLWNKKKIKLVNSDLKKLRNMYHDLSFCPSLINKKSEIIRIEKKYMVILQRWRIEDFFIKGSSNENEMNKLEKDVVNLYQYLKYNLDFSELLKECLYNASFYSSVLRISALNDFTNNNFKEGIKKYELIKLIAEKTGYDFFNLKEEAKFVYTCEKLYLPDNEKLFVKNIKNYFKDDFHLQKKLYQSLKIIKDGELIIISNPPLIKLKINEAHKTTPGLLDNFNNRTIKIIFESPWFRYEEATIELYDGQKVVFLAPAFTGYFLKRREHYYLRKEFLSSPGENVAANKYVLKWDKFYNADHYELEICAFNSGLMEPIYFKSNIKKNKYTIDLSHIKKNNIYYRVCAVTKNGLKSRWSNYIPVVPVNIKKVELKYEQNFILGVGLEYLRDEFNKTFNPSFNLELYTKLFGSIYPGLGIGYYIKPFVFNAAGSYLGTNVEISPSVMLFRGYDKLIHVVKAHWMGFGVLGFGGGQPWEVYLSYGLGKWPFLVSLESAIHLDPFYLNGFGVSMEFYPFKAKPKVVREKPSTSHKNWLLSIGSGIYSGEYFDFLPVIPLSQKRASVYHYDEYFGSFIDFMVGINRRVIGNFYLGLNINYMYRFSNFSLMYFDSYDRLIHLIHFLYDPWGSSFTFGYGIGLKHFVINMKATYYNSPGDQYNTSRVGIDTYGIYLSYIL